jgi:hypothetical protein
MSARKKKHIKALLLQVHPLAAGEWSKWVNIPTGWEDKDERQRRDWLYVNHPIWLKVEDDGPVPSTLHRYPLIDTNTYQVNAELRAFEPVKQAAVRARVKELKEDPSLMGVTAPTPEILDAIMKMPETQNLIFRKSREDVEPAFAEQEGKLREALHQAAELRALRIQYVLKPYQPAIRGIISALVSDRGVPSSEELDMTRSTAEYFDQISKGMTQFRAELVKLPGEVVVKLVEKFDKILNPYGDTHTTP